MATIDDLIAKIDELKELKTEDITTQTEVLNTLLQEAKDSFATEVAKSNLRSIRLLRNVNPYRGSFYQEMMGSRYGDIFVAGMSADRTGGSNASNNARLWQRINFPSDIEVIDLVGGHNSFLAQVKDANYIYVFGSNDCGCLGTGNSSAVRTPAKVTFPAKVTKIISSSGTANQSSFVLCEDGALYAAGRNNIGQLGIGTTADANRFIRITIPSISDIFMTTYSSTGQISVFAIATNGDLYAWGNNTNGTLGIGNTTNQSLPTKVANLPSKPIRQIQSFIYTQDSSWYANAYIIYDDEVLGAGNSNHRQLLNTNTDNTRFISIVDNSSRDKLIFFGATAYATLGYINLTTGELKSWGYGEYGFGDARSGTNQGINNQTIIRDEFRAQNAILAYIPYRYYSFAFLNKDTNTLLTFGHNVRGKLANGTSDTKRRFEKVNTPASLVDIAYTAITSNSNGEAILLATDGKRLFGSGHGVTLDNCLDFNTDCLSVQNIPH